MGWGKKRKLKTFLINLFWMVFTLLLAVIFVLAIYRAREEYQSLRIENKQLRSHNEALLLDSMVTHDRLDRCALRDKDRGLDYTDTYD